MRSSLSFARLFAVSCSLLTLAHAQSPQASSPQLVFTFDDLPAHGPLPPGVTREQVASSILRTLKQQKMPPVYGFVNAFRVAHYPYQLKILQQWVAAGQPLGNHTDSHPGLDESTTAAYETDIARDEPLLQEVDPAGDWHWFRYPYLDEGTSVEKREEVRHWLAEHHYKIAEVSMDFQDYNWNDAYARCSTQQNAAAIKTLHDTYLSAASQAAAAFRELSHRLYGRDVPYILLMHLGAFDARMLPELIAQYRAEGFGFTTLEAASADEAYAFDPAKPTGGSTFFEQVAFAKNIPAPELPDYSKRLDKLCR